MTGQCGGGSVRLHRSDVRKVLTVSFLALVHFVLTIVAVATSFGSGMSRFDTGRR